MFPDKRGNKSPNIIPVIGQANPLPIQLRYNPLLHPPPSSLCTSSSSPPRCMFPLPYSLTFRYPHLSRPPLFCHSSFPSRLRVYRLINDWSLINIIMIICCWNLETGNGITPPPPPFPLLSPSIPVHIPPLNILAFLHTPLPPSEPIPLPNNTLAHFSEHEFLDETRAKRVKI